MTVPAVADRRLAGIDGLRAFAALWVVLFHVRVFSQAHLGVPLLDLFARSGSTGVSLFLVISGFCLYLPFAAGRSDRFTTGRFLRRRFLRLMPAFYASLAVVLLLNVFGGPRLGFQALSAPQAIFQALTHATMTHALFPSTFYALNGAYWSLALEWQLYLGLPLLIIGIRLIGLRNTLLLAVLCNVVYRLALSWAIGRGLVAPQSPMALAVLPNLLPGRWAEFVLGMLAAELYRRGSLTKLAGRGQLAVMAVLPVLVIAGFRLVTNPLSHLLFGLVFFLAVILVLAPSSPLGRVFSWTPLVSIGLMSYSLYLVHQPVVQAAAFLLREHAGLGPQAVLTWLLLAIVPLIVVLAWVLFMTVERRSLSDWESVASTAAGRGLLLPTRLVGAAGLAARLGRQASLRLGLALRLQD